MSRYGENMKLEVATKATKAVFKTQGKDYNVTVLNYSQPGLLKRVAKYMASQNPDTDFSVIWFYNYRERQFDVTLTTSHRPGSTVDIIKIAKSFGGSGFKDISRFVLSGQPGDIGKVIKL